MLIHSVLSRHLFEVVGDWDTLLSISVLAYESENNTFYFNSAITPGKHHKSNISTQKRKGKGKLKRILRTF